MSWSFRSFFERVLLASVFLAVWAWPVCAFAGGVCYEVFVYSFCDSNGDGIGDLKGLEQKLDYINDGDELTTDDLGCDMIWVMPVFPSPTYHKYDVTDYMAVDPVYGSMEDMDRLIRECHDRGIRLILDLPLNHTSSQHPWFTAACDYLKDLPQGADALAEDCPYLDYYHFSREPGNGYAPLEGTEWFYEARFWDQMPDLDLDQAPVRSAVEEILDFWLDKGVDGFRLDAVTYHYSESRESNIEFLRWLNQTAKSKVPDCYLVGEAWTDMDTYAAYYESGIDSLFDFAFSGQDGVISKVTRGKKDASWYGRMLVKEEQLFAEYGDHVINAPFYTNHDMARSAGDYTRDDGSRVKLSEALNLLMPGQAFLYYGEELGMKGSGKDENKRAPMFWSAEPAAEGMCQGPPEMEEVKMKFPPLEEQKEDPYSIWSYTREAIRIRNRYPAIGSGKTVLSEELSGEDICVIERTSPDEEPVLLVINTSDESREILLAGSGCDAYKTLDAQLTVSEGAVRLEEGTLTLPPFGIGILKK